MVTFLEEERDVIRKSDNIECLVLILMSHGKGAYIYGNNNVPIKLTDLIGMFDTDHCRCLDEKPRLIFVQACRGGRKTIFKKIVIKGFFR